MSNLRNTTRLPLRSSMTNKGKAHTSANDLLERKTRTLEGGLNKSKSNTQRDQNKSTMDIHRRGRSIPAYSRDKPPTGIKSIIKCGQCEKEDAKMKCMECVEVYCTNCYSQFHLRGALQRHHCVLLPVNPKKTSAENSDIQLPEPHTNESEETHNSKTDVASFQQSFLQWREENINKSKRTQQKRGLTSPTQNRIDYSNKLPYLDSNPPKVTSDDNALLKKSQTTANQQIFNQRSIKQDQPKVNVRVRIHHSFSDHKNLIDVLEPLTDVPTPRSDELVPVGEDLPRDHELAQIEEQDRPYTHISAKSISRPTSSSIKKDSIPSRSNSITLPEEPVRSDLAAKSNDELEAILNSKLNLSRASSARSENLDEPTSWRPSKSTSNNINAQSVVIDRNTLAQFDSALDELFDESKIELAYLLDSAKDQPSGRDINSNTVTPHRHSPFSFSNSLYKMSRINSASSRDTGEGGFFTDVPPRQSIPATPPPALPPPILECSTSNEWKTTSENQPTEPNPILLPKLSIPSLSQSAPKDPIKQEETNEPPKSPINNDSRPGSSLSSSSLPISVTSSKLGFDGKARSSTTSSRKSSSTTTVDNLSSSSSARKNTTSTTAKDTSSSSTTLKDSSSSSNTTAKDTSSSSSSETKTSSAPTTTSNKTTTSVTSENTSSTATASKPEPMVTKDEKDVVLPFAPDEDHQESTISMTDKSSYQAQTSEDPNEPLEPPPTNHLTRGTIITEKDLPIKKKVRHPKPTNDESSQYRKLEFSVGDGLKWQEASMESLSSTKTIVSKRSTPHSFTPSNPINTELATQFSKYDNDDGRSSAADQNLNDEECFNQLCQELCSELDTKGSDEDALLNEHILKILQNARRPFHEKDLPMLETKLPDDVKC